MHAPHINSQISLGNILTMIGMAGAVVVQSAWLGSVKTDFENRLVVEERNSLKYSVIIDTLVKSQAINDRRLDEGEAVRKSRVPVLEETVRDISVVNAKIAEIIRTVLENREAISDNIQVTRDLAKEITSLREAVAGLQSLINLRQTIRPGKP